MIASNYILPALLVSFTSCMSVKQLQFAGAEHIAVSKEGDHAQINFNIIGHNPNNVSFKLSELQTKITINGQSFANLQSDSVMRLKRNTDFSIPASAKASQEDLMKIVSSGLALLLNGDKVEVEINGDFTLKKFLFRKKFSFQLNEKIDQKMLNGFF